ncbi:MAG: hypothetical protein MI739_12950 [Bacteroidales bacterium]|nr:hypothetical protein [Bacteroidales bacterium]
MKINKLFTLILLCLLSLKPFAQRNNIWITYGHPKFLYTPGVEANYFLNKYIGIQLGVSTYLLDYNKNQIVNITNNAKFNFYDVNIGACTMLLNKKHKLGATLGIKVHYAPEFDVLHYYEAKGYNIYFDSSELRPSYGADLGLFYCYKRITGIIKFDTSRNKFRVGIGYSFKK